MARVDLHFSSAYVCHAKVDVLLIPAILCHAKDQQYGFTLPCRADGARVGTNTPPNISTMQSQAFLLIL